jgi:hypothetical protein
MPFSTLTVAEVQQWLEATKFTVVEADAVELETSAIAKVYGRLGSSYDTSVWDATSVPPLISTVLSMIVASWLWRRQNASAANERGNYGEQLEASAYELIDGISEGIFDLDDEKIETSYPSFFPTDAAALLAETDPTHPDAAKAAFTMGQVF